MRYPFAPTGLAIIKQIYNKTSVGKDTEKLEPSHIAHIVEM